MTFKTEYYNAAGSLKRIVADCNGVVSEGQRCSLSWDDPLMALFYMTRVGCAGAVPQDLSYYTKTAVWLEKKIYELNCQKHDFNDEAGLKEIEKYREELFTIKVAIEKATQTNASPG